MSASASRPTHPRTVKDMFAFLIGGSGSGKSAFAEQLLQSLPGMKIYLATMQPSDGECRARISRHRSLRAGKGFRTEERYTDLSGLSLPESASVLLEDLTNLLANEIYSPCGGGASAAAADIDSLLSCCCNLIVVSNDVFIGGADYSPETLVFLRELAQLNRSLAARADLAAEMVCGLPNVLKGELPW